MVTQRRFGTYPILNGKAFRCVAILALVVLAHAAQARTPCATIQKLKWERAGNGLFPLMANFDRPFDPEQFMDSEQYPLRVHWQNQIFEDEAPLVLESLEEAWEHQVVDLGYPAPVGDGELGGGDNRVDVYLLGLGPGAVALTLVDDDIDLSDGRANGPSHIQLDATQPSYLESLHHEFQHVLQFSMDRQETIMFMEATAVYLEALAFPASAQWGELVPDFQKYPQAPVFTDGVAWWDLWFSESFYEYGAALFIMYLDENYGAGDGVLLREMWEILHQDEETETNEPDWMDAADTILNIPVSEMIADFATWRALVGPRATAEDGPTRATDLNATALLYTRSLVSEALDGRLLRNTDGFEAPHQLGCFTFDVYAKPSEALTLDIALASLAEEAERTLAFSWLVEGEDGGLARFESEPGKQVALEVTVPASGYFLGAACDVSASDADDLPVPHPVELSVWNTALPRVNVDGGVQDGGSILDGGEDPEEDHVQCGCTTIVPSPQSALKEREENASSVVFFGLVGPFILWQVRRRGASNRR